MITFIGLSNDFLIKIKEYFPNAKSFNGRVEQMNVSGERIFFISPANSLGFMDGGIDYAYSRKMFQDVEHKIKKSFSDYGKDTKLGRKYMPIGCATIVNPTKFTEEYKKFNNNTENTYVIAAPTMCLPQNVKDTNNVYHSMKAILSILIGNKYDYSKDHVVIPALCGGYGMVPTNIICQQIDKAYKEIKSILPSKKVYICDNYLEILQEQHSYYENLEFVDIDYSKIIQK